MAAAMRRKVGPFPTLWLIMIVWGIAGAAAGLAARNNEDNYLGVFVLIVAGMICGGILTWPDLSLVRFLAYSAAKTRRVIVATSAPRLVLSGLMALVAGGLAGLQIVLTLMSFGLVMVCLSVWLLLLITFGMTKTESGAIGFAVTEVFVAILLSSFFQSAIVAAPWLVGRAAFNYRRANRRRWREPK